MNQPSEEYNMSKEDQSIEATMPDRHNIGKLAEALAKARPNFKQLKKGSENPHFKSKYASLEEVIACSYDALSAEGIAVIQRPSSTSADVVQLETWLVHKSGQYFKSVMTLPIDRQRGVQGAGSALTYARRYSLQSMLNLAAEDDDDGNKAQAGTQRSTNSQQREPDSVGRSRSGGF